MTVVAGKFLLEEREHIQICNVAFYLSNTGFEQQKNSQDQVMTMKTKTMKD